MSRQIPLSDDAHHLAPIIDDGQSPNLMARHLPQAFPDGIVRVTRERSVGHTISYDRVTNISFTGYKTDGDVAIRQYPYEALFHVNYWKRAEVIIAHQPGRVSDSILGMNRERVTRHHVARAQVIDRVPGTPVISLTSASLVFIFISAASPVGLFVSKPRTQFISRAPENSPRAFKLPSSNAGLVIHIVITRHFISLR
jgi:hypothetical protein